MSKPTNFDELIAAARSDINLTSRDQKSSASLLKRFCQIIGLPPALLAIDIALVRNVMDKANPGSHNVSLVSWRKIRSHVWLAMERADILVIRATGFPRTTEVVCLFRIIGTNKLQIALTPILKFTTSHNIPLWDFCQTHIPAFRAWMQGGYSKTNWQRAYKRSVSAWTTFQKLHPDEWPNHPIVASFDVDDFYYPTWDFFPDLRTEYDRHLEKIAENKPRRYGNDRKILSASSLEAREDHIRRFASAVARARGLASHDVKTFEYLTDPDVVNDAVNLLMERFETERNGGVYQTLRHVNSIARHHAGRSIDDLKKLTEIRNSVKPPDAPADKNIEVVRQFREEKLRERFCACPGEILAALKRKKILTPGDINRGMLAFLAAILMKVPMRLSEVLALQYGTTFFDAGSGRERKVSISLPPEMVKNNEPRRAILGEQLVKHYDIYMKIIRPHLAPSTNPHLFPSGAVGARNNDHLSKSLAKMMHKEIGVRMTPHQFRHVIGYIFLKAQPGCYDAVRRLLGHRSLKTTLKFYAFVLDDDANEVLDETIDDLAARRSLRRGRRAA